AYVAAQTVAIKEEAKDPAFDPAGKDIINKAAIEKYLGTNTKVVEITVNTATNEAITKATVGVSKTVKGTTVDYTVVFEDGKEPLVTKK
ncbi:MAG: hypothetical protein RR469_04670, partial [Erysipelotrichaceae bacterium]